MGESRRIIVDAGAMVAVVDARDEWHSVAAQKFRDLPKPFITCESALSEAHYILKRTSIGRSKISELFTQKVVEIGFDLTTEIEVVNAFMEKYRDVPMSLADACLVRMTEVHTASKLLTFDSDFQVYRRNQSESIETIPIV